MLFGSTSKMLPNNGTPGGWGIGIDMEGGMLVTVERSLHGKHGETEEPARTR